MLTSSHTSRHTKQSQVLVHKDGLRWLLHTSRLTVVSKRTVRRLGGPKVRKNNVTREVTVLSHDR